MANIIITTTAKTFKIESGATYLNAIGSPLVRKKRNEITGVYFSKDSTYICIEIEGIKDFLVAPTTIINANGMPINVIVDSIDGVALVTLQDIFDNFSIIMEV
jgi:hypothetical protein